MLKDNIFKISFFISFLWHLFCIFAFTLVITPKGFTLHQFPDISFVGSAEYDVVYDSYNKIRPALMPTPYKENFNHPLFVSSAGQAASLTGPQCNDYISNFVLFGEYAPVVFKNLQIPKQMPDFSVDKQKEVAAAKGGLEKESGDDLDVSMPEERIFENLVLKGALSRRGIIYKPPMPVFPQWVRQAIGAEFTIDLNIAVSSIGVVQAATMLNTSGYSEVDVIALRYIRELIFQPAPQNQIQQGILRVKLKMA